MSKTVETQGLPEAGFGPRWNRRRFAAGAALAAGSALAGAQTGWGLGLRAPTVADVAPDYTLEIGEVEWELGPRKKVKTVAYNGQIPGKLLRLKEGTPATIEIVNRLDREEIVHWHGLWIPVDVDGSMEEGSPMITAGGRTLIHYTPRPMGLHWYHTHAMAGRSLNRGLFTGQSGVLLVEARNEPGRYDREQFVVLQDWEPFYAASDDGSLMVHYAAASINGKMMGAGEPVRVKEGERLLLHVLNASATETHWLALGGHEFTVLSMDGSPVATEARVKALRLGPAERITAVVEMNAPGVWVLGEPRKGFRKAGMGAVVEYANRTGKPQEPAAPPLTWDYRAFGHAKPVSYTPDATIPLVFTSRFKGHGALDQWMINGKSYPQTETPVLREGLRHRLVFDNRSMDDHPVHIHRHNFELVLVQGARMSGVRKDVVIVEAGTRVEADLVANNPGNTLFHCHQQDHMDAGFMMLFHYA